MNGTAAILPVKFKPFAGTTEAGHTTKSTAPSSDSMKDTLRAVNIKKIIPAEIEINNLKFTLIKLCSS
ncbi:MAG: hypothetical protein K9L78_02675 [Victivallales bacterium]|nr:hypothetical protein [Victivallales bacterium]MCF7889000.1 hypothetical protein [Victivallales bacterium]